MLQNPEYVKILLSHSIKVPEEFVPESDDQE